MLWQYTKGLHELGNGCFAYLQPDGGWGWSNAGLSSTATDRCSSTRCSTCGSPREMLDGDARRGAAARRSARVVNTHANGDHCYGNQLVTDAEIIASRGQRRARWSEVPAERARAADDAELAPARRGRRRSCTSSSASSSSTASTPRCRPDVRRRARRSRSAADGRADRGRPGAHARRRARPRAGRRTVFTGDILFIGGTPIVWAGPVDNWIAACDLMLGMDVDTVVPGHGPITDKAGVQAMRDYLLYVEAEARRRHDAGMSASKRRATSRSGEFARLGRGRAHRRQRRTPSTASSVKAGARHHGAVRRDGRFHAELKAKASRDHGHGHGHQHAP